MTFTRCDRVFFVWYLACPSERLFFTGRGRLRQPAKKRVVAAIKGDVHAQVETGEAKVIRGAIEVAHDKLVSGWIYAGPYKVREHLVLAFCGPRCVGSGRVEIFRGDLAEAGLGDGYCGFHFPVILESGEHPASIVVRLADSDAALIQPTSRVGA